MTYYLKIITGFRDDQFITVPMQEAHKAYFLFRNPEQRGVFENGAAIVGSSIRELKPDWNATMGWNPDHKLTANDYTEINRDGVGEKMALLLEKAKQASDLITENPNILTMKLGDVIKTLPENKTLQIAEEVAKGMSL